MFAYFLGYDDIKTDTEYSGTSQDIYLTDIHLQDTDTSVWAPVYYVTVVAYNGAGERSDEHVSSPVVVLPEDVPGLLIVWHFLTWILTQFLATFFHFCDIFFLLLLSVERM